MQESEVNLALMGLGLRKYRVKGAIASYDIRPGNGVRVGLF